MKIPTKFKSSPTLYRFGYEDGEQGKPNVSDKFVGVGRKAYEAGYIQGEQAKVKV